jgi:ankyrin repeat protein
MKKIVFILFLFLIIASSVATRAWCEDIYESVKYGDLNKVREFIEKEASFLNKKDTFGMTPLHYAVEYNEPDIVKFLVEKGAKKNLADLQGRTPLDIAKDRKQNEIIKILTSSSPRKQNNLVLAKKPEQAVALLFYYIDKKQYSNVWQTLTERSRREITQLIADKAKTDYDRIRKLMDATESKASKAFWETYDNKMKNFYSMASFGEIKKTSDSEALVNVKYNNQTIKFRVFFENGGWKTGLTESN